MWEIEAKLQEDIEIKDRLILDDVLVLVSIIMKANSAPVLPKFGVFEPIRSFLLLKLACFCSKPKNLKNKNVSIGVVYCIPWKISRKVCKIVNSH